MGQTQQRITVAVAAAIVVLLVLAPAALASDVYVSSYEAGIISPFSIGPSGALTPIECSTCVTGTDSDPEGVAISPNGKYLYTVAYGYGDVSPFTILSGGSLASIACPDSNCATGSEPFWLAVTPNGRFLYVTNHGGGKVSQYSIGSDGSVTPIKCTGTGGANCKTGDGPEEPAISPNGKYLYVENSGTGNMSAFSIGSDGALTPITCSDCTTGSYPWTSGFTPNGKYLYVLNDESASVSPFTVASNGSLSPVTCSPADCDAGTSGGEGGFYGAYSLAVSPSGKFLYVVNYNDDAVFPFSVDAGGSLTPITCTPSSNCSTGAGSEPTAAAMSPDGRFLYVTDYGTGQVSVFAVATNGTLSPVTCSDCGGLNEPEYGQAVVASPDQAPTAAFSTKGASSGLQATFNASSSTASSGQTVASYAWTFGDGSHTTSTTATTEHTYAKAGTYRVTLTLTDNAGCSTSIIFTGQTAYCNGGPAARKTISLAVGKHISATTQKATAVTSSTAVLHALITTQAASVDWHFEYGLTTSYGHDTPVKTIPAGHSEPVAVSIKITGLKPHTTYHFRIDATTSGDTTTLAGSSHGSGLTLKTS